MKASFFVIYICICRYTYEGGMIMEKPLRDEALTLISW